MLSVSLRLGRPVALERGRERGLLVVVEPDREAVRGEDRQPGVLQRDQAHQHVVGARDLLLVDAGGLVAVMAVGDQQLGVLERGLEGVDRGGVVDAPQLVDRAVLVGDLAPRARRA